MVKPINSFVATATKAGNSLLGEVTVFKYLFLCANQINSGGPNCVYKLNVDIATNW